MTIELGYEGIALLIASHSLLAATNPSAVSDIGVAWLSKKVGLKPSEIAKYEDATDGESQ